MMSVVLFMLGVPPLEVVVLIVSHDRAVRIRV
jgi:hypothetical protein